MTDNETGLFAQVTFSGAASILSRGNNPLEDNTVNASFSGTGSLY